MIFLAMIFLIIILVIVCSNNDNNKGGKGSTSKHIDINDIMMFDCMNKGKTR